MLLNAKGPVIMDHGWDKKSMTSLVVKLSIIIIKPVHTIWSAITFRMITKVRSHASLHWNLSGAVWPRRKLFQTRLGRWIVVWSRRTLLIPSTYSTGKITQDETDLASTNYMQKYQDCNKNWNTVHTCIIILNGSQLKLDWYEPMLFDHDLAEISLYLFWNLATILPDSTMIFLPIV